MDVVTIPLKNQHEFDTTVPMSGEVQEYDVVIPEGYTVKEYNVTIPSSPVAHVYSATMPKGITGTIVLRRSSGAVYINLGDLGAKVAVKPSTTGLYRSRTLTPSTAAIVKVVASALALGGMDEWTIGDYADDLQYLLSDMDNSTIGTLSGRKPV